MEDDRKVLRSRLDDVVSPPVFVSLLTLYRSRRVVVDTEYYSLETSFTH